MRDWQDGRLRYLMHFSDGGTGVRHRDEPLDGGDELSDGTARYVVERDEQPGHQHALGHACGRLVEP